jgi:hypothetical protein
MLKISRDRDSYWQSRLSREESIRQMWEESMARVAREHEELQSKMGESEEKRGNPGFSLTNLKILTICYQTGCPTGDRTATTCCALQGFLQSIVRILRLVKLKPGLPRR